MGPAIFIFIDWLFFKLLQTKNQTKVTRPKNPYECATVIFQSIDDKSKVIPVM